MKQIINIITEKTEFYRKRPLTLIELINPVLEVREKLERECYQRAVLLYEKCGDRYSVAECSIETGDVDLAADIYKRMNLFQPAAQLFILSGQYTKALDCLESWQLTVSTKDIVSKVEILLGISSCLNYLDINYEKAHQSYRKARQLIEKNDYNEIAGQCWELLGNYGILVKRKDLIQLGYEKALSCYGESHNYRRFLAAKRYMKAVKKNRLLALDIQKRIVLWDRTKQLKYENKRITNYLGMEFVYIPPGTFLMGSPEDEVGRKKNETLHRVTLTKGFYMQTTPVTNKQWVAIYGESGDPIFPVKVTNNQWLALYPLYYGDDRDDYPVGVSWDDAVEFIKKLNDREGTNVYRLPTEAEWEYAFRAGSNSRFCFGDDEKKISEYAWHGREIYKVAQLKPNAWGLYDMHGNVLEWCQDWYAEYSNEPVIDPVGPATGSSKVYRGRKSREERQEEESRPAYRGYGALPGQIDIDFRKIGFRMIISCL